MSRCMPVMGAQKITAKTFPAEVLQGIIQLPGGLIESMTASWPQTWTKSTLQRARTEARPEAALHREALDQR